MSGRGITGDVESALAGGHVIGATLVEMDFQAGFLRVNTSAQDISWNGYTWLGVGRIGGIEPVGEGFTLEARSLRFFISGIDPAHLATAIGTQYQGRSCKVWFAPLSAACQVLGDPVMVFHGRLDTMDIELGAMATITVSAESRLADWDRPRVRRYNSEDQSITDATDRGFEFVPQMVEKQIRWGY